MINYIKFFIQKKQSAKYIRKGHCKQCGSCCRNIVFYIGKEPVKTKQQFEQLKNFDKHYKNFYINGKDTDNKLLFTCNALSKNNKCKIYHFRAMFCRLYPNPKQSFISNGGKLQDGCGYYFEPDKKFNSFIN